MNTRANTMTSLSEASSGVPTRLALAEALYHSLDVGGMWAPPEYFPPLRQMAGELVDFCRQHAAVEPPAPPPPPEERTLTDIFAYARGELDDPQQRARIEDLLKEPQWKAHYESVQFFDLECAVLARDIRDIEELVERWELGTSQPTDFCFAAAESGAFDCFIRGEDQDDAEWTVNSGRNTSTSASSAGE